MLVPKSQIIPEKCDMAEIVRLVTDTHQTMVVQIVWKEALARHIYEIIADVELEVDVLVLCLQFLFSLSEVKNLDSIDASLEVNPERLRRLVLVMDECFLVTLVCVVILVAVIGLQLFISIALLNEKLHDFVVIRTVKDLHVEAHFHANINIMAVKHFEFVL